MLRMKPVELVMQQCDRYMARCEAMSDAVEFVFMVEDIDSELELIKCQDAFYLVAQEDDAGWGLLKSVTYFVELQNQSEKAFGLPQIACYPMRLACTESDHKSAREYVFSFIAGEEEVERIFMVRGDGNNRVIGHGAQLWYGKFDGYSWQLTDADAKEATLLLAVLNFDWAQTGEYTDEQLESSLDKIDWREIFLESEQNTNWGGYLHRKKKTGGDTGSTKVITRSDLVAWASGAVK